MSFKAEIATVVPPQPLREFDQYHPQMINIICLDPNGPIKVVIQLAKVSQPDGFGPYELLNDEPAYSNVIKDLRPYMAENPALMTVVANVQEQVRVLAESLGWIPSASGVDPSGIDPSGNLLI